MRGTKTFWQEGDGPQNDGYGDKDYDKDFGDADDLITDLLGDIFEFDDRAGETYMVLDEAPPQSQCLEESEAVEHVGDYMS